MSLPATSTNKTEKELMKLRKSFIEFYKQVGDVTLTCKTFNISRPTFYKWYKRYDPNDPTTLIDESKAPKTHRSTKPVELLIDSREHVSDREQSAKAPPPRYQGMNNLTPTPPPVTPPPSIVPRETPITISPPTMTLEESPVSSNASFQHPLASLFPAVKPHPHLHTPNMYPNSGMNTHPPVTPVLREDVQERAQTFTYEIEPEITSFPQRQHHILSEPAQTNYPSVGSLLRDRMHAHSPESPEPKPYVKPIDTEPKMHARANTHSILSKYTSRIQAFTSSGSSKNKNGILIAGVIGAIIIGVVPSLFFYQEKTKGDAAGNSAQSPETDDIINKVSVFMELPTDEEPTIATVTDLDKLRGQPFFQNAKKGDVVLIYDKAARIILFDPIANKIINAASTNIETPTPTTAPVTVDPNKTYRVGLLNGTEITGLTRTVEKNLLEKIEKITIGARDNAKKQGYTQTLVVDLTGTSSAMANSVAVALRGAISPLPEGEISPPLSPGEAPLDILAIIGSDYVK